MPNWNSNAVSIEAPIREVLNYLVQDKTGEYFFNMHKLYPEKFEADDGYWNDGWDYDWAIENTGSKWFPRIHSVDGDDVETMLDYETAWAPNNLTLLRLSDITSWKVINIFEEPWMCFEGEFICEAGKILKDEEREYRPYCDICEEKHDDESTIYYEDSDTHICKACMALHEGEL